MMRYHLTHVRMETIKKNIGENVEKRENLYLVSGNINQNSHCGIQIGDSTKNKNRTTM